MKPQVAASDRFGGKLKMRRLSKHLSSRQEFSSQIIALDELDYLVDILAELKAMAMKAETGTLAGLLDVAHHEAKLQLRLRQQ